MKTKLLSLIFAMVLTSSITNAQTKTWDFGNNTTTWPVDATGVTGNVVRDNLGIYMGITSSSNIGIVEESPKVFPDGYSGTNRFKLNGLGYPTGPFQVMPTQRYVYFATAGNCTVKIWFRTGGSGTRTLYITNGTTVVGSLAGTDSSVGYYFQSNYVGGATNLYIYGDQSNNLYKIEVTGALGTTTLGTNDFKIGSAVNVFSNGKQVHISNVISNTQVDVYSMTGALVKSFNTDADTSFDSLNAGLYIVNVQSGEGRKAVKVLIQ